MAYLTDIERLNYYEGEFLGALDFAAEQDYHRDMRRRHNVGQHTWGIVSGLDLAQVPNGQTSGAFTEVDVYVQPGMAVDAFGREILVLGRTQLTQDLFAAFFDANPKAVAKTMYVWIAFQQEFAQASTDVCATQNTANPYARIQESFHLIVTSTSPPTPALNDPLVIDGTQMTPPDEPASPPSPAPAPTPGEIVLPYDGSVPYQEFAEDDTTANWYIPLGQVLWDPHNQVFYQTGSSTAGRQFVGTVAAAIEAPAGQLLIQDRATPWPLPADPTYSGVAVEIGGSLTVDRLLTAEDDIYLIEPGHLYFKDASGSDSGTPLWIRRNSHGAAGADLHIHIGDNSDPTNKPQRLTIAAGPDENSEQLVMEVRADGNANLPNGSLAIGVGLTIDQLNVNDGKIAPGLTFGLLSGEGIASKRTATGNQYGLDFYTFFNPRLSITNDGRVGIATQTPASKLDVNGDVSIASYINANGNRTNLLGTDGAGNHWIMGGGLAEPDFNAIGLSVSNKQVLIGPKWTLNVQGNQNLIAARQIPLVVKNNGAAPNFWSITYPSVFTDVYAVFAVFQGFSIYDNSGNLAFTNYGNNQDAKSIPQHAFVRVDAYDQNGASGYAFCSESDPAQSGDNCILFTLVVIGRPIV